MDIVIIVVVINSYISTRSKLLIMGKLTIIDRLEYLSEKHAFP